MNERNRYRITGSIFLIALAVILIPMMFDGAGAPMREAPPMPEPRPLAQPLPDFAEVVPATDVVERVQALQDEIDDEGYSTDSGTLFGEPVLLPADADTAVWAVQAASFASMENARAFREDLRASGYEAFISTVKGRDSDAPMYRVAVGPLLSFADAEQMQASIGAEFALQPTVMEMTQ